MKRNLILSISAVLLSLSVVAQISKDDTVNYSKIYDNGDFNFYAFGASYDMSINQYNFTLLALGLDATYLSDNFYFNVGSRFHFGEKITEYAFHDTPTTRSVYEEEKSRDLSLRGSYFFVKSTKVTDLSVTLKSSRNVDYIMFVPAQMVTKIGVDVGITFMSSYYNFGELTMTGLDNAGSEVEFGGNTASYLTQQVLRLGVSRMKMNDFKVKTDKYGDKMVTDFSKLYFHTLIGLNSELDDVYQVIPASGGSGQSVTRRLDINTNAEILPIGLAVGLESMQAIGKHYFGGYVAELGLMPGPKYNIANNIYLNIKLRFAFGNKL